MIGPSLSPLERSCIENAAKLAASGVKIHWRNVGRRLEYIADGKPHLVLTSGTDRVHAELVRQTKELWEKAHAEAVRADRTVGSSAEAEKGNAARAVEVETVPRMDLELSVPDLRESEHAGQPHGEGRRVDEGNGRLVCAAVLHGDAASRPA
jgi:hypothetical protein